jgi:ferredoxin-NADP reductase
MDESGAVTLYIKSFGEGKTQWSGQLLAAAKLVQAGTISLEDIGFHIGGPNGGLMIKEPLDGLDQIVLVSGGVGVTPMIAILSDLVAKKYTGKVDFIWSTRSSSELDCFRELFAKCSAFPKMNIQVYYTGPGGDTEGCLPSLAAAEGFTLNSGRPALDKLISVEGKQSCGILCCGPEALMISVEGVAGDLQRAGKSVLFHRETFEF